jgi:hypothetical protein
MGMWLLEQGRGAKTQDKANVWRNAASRLCLKSSVISNEQGGGQTVDKNR